MVPFPMNPTVLPSVSELRTVDVHRDLSIVESGKWYGNTDPRFGSAPQVWRNRTALMAHISCRHSVVMVPKASDRLLDLDRGKISATSEDYPLWPVELREDTTYDPDAPPYMIDLPTDGLITTKKGVGLMLNAADCAPLVLYDAGQQVLGLAHIGREGAIKDLGPKMIRYMRDYYGAKPARILAYFGPAIASESYVLPHLSDALQAPDWKPFLKKTPEGYATDIVGYAAQRLMEAGVQADNISYSAIDVAAANSGYFSFVRHQASNEPDGRNGFMVAMHANDA